jgi:outer membrane protein assembly factor BamB
MWSQEIGPVGLSSPAFSEGTVYIGSNDHKVYALNASTGTPIWNYTTGNDVSSAPAVAGGMVFVGSYDYNVYGLNASTGVRMWSYETGDGVSSSPVVVNGTVFIGSEDGSFYAFGPEPVIPEFPSFLILPLFMLATLATVVVWKRKRFNFS